MTAPPPRIQLWELYKIAVDEYRFEVKLNWDRTVFYLTLNSGLVSVATGLLKFGTASAVNLLVAVVFAIGLCVSLIGIAAITKGHDYYRRTIIKKTLLEDQLRLTRASEDYPARPTLAVGTTIGQAEQWQILYNTEAWLQRPLRLWTITFWIRVVLILLCIINLAGIGVSWWMFQHPPGPQEVPPAIRVIPVTRL